jgi:hypothetical protein
MGMDYKTMNLWEKYHFVYYFGLFVSIFVFFVMAGVFNLKILGFVISIILFLIALILSNKIVCPKCGTAVGISQSLFSRYYKGFHFVMPKKCCKCGYDLTLIQNKN